MDVFGQMWLYSGKVVVFWEKEVVFGKSGCIRANVVVFGKMRKYSCKVVIFRQKWLSLGKSVFILAKMVLFEKKWL